MKTCTLSNRLPSGSSGWSLLTILFLLLLGGIRPASGEPLQVVDLAGTWGFDPNDGPATTIQVPGGGWYKQGFTGTAEADYSTTISIPDIGQPQVTELKFGAVNYQSDLYIDEVLVGSSVQSHTAATFDITDHVTPGSNHDVRLHVKGSGAMRNPATGQTIVPDGARSWADFLPEGIFRSAELRIYPQVYIQDVFVKPSVETTSLSYDVWIHNDSASPANVTLAGSLDSWNGDPWSYPALPNQAVSIPAGQTTKVTIGPINWNLGTDSYWWPNVPYEPGYTAQLHELDLSISGGGTHATSVRFGFRECRQVSPDASHTIYTLNGVRVNFRGDSLQGANYDRIDSNGAAPGGLGDAFSTYPGFLPGPNGWPKAVDHYQRLNYNVVRIHQIPATPYMLDVCDEMGLMIIDETGIRGSSGRQDFVTGYDNMIQHAKDLFRQNRNHASIVRSSLSNEPDHAGGGLAFQEQFHQDLYDAAKEVDGTRPLSIDAAYTEYNALAYDDLAVFRHYGLSNNAYGQYTEDVFERTDRPYGSGEHIWYADNTAQGFAWFATSTQAMRAKGASDIRPYTLLSAWSSVIPGTETDEMQLENPPWIPDDFFPLYGEDNLLDPWSNHQIQRVQAGFSPVLVVDTEYWEDNKYSNAGGEWPANVPFVEPLEEMARTLRIYNDTFSGTAVDVTWELRQGSATGSVIDSGTINATVPLGYTATEDISFTIPDAPEDTEFYLVLSAEKGGVELFREEDQKFTVFVFDMTEVTGTAFGTTPSWSPGTEFDKATDGNLATYFDYQQPDGGHTGIDLGDGNASRINAIIFTPRSGFESRMDGGQFQGSNDGTNYTTFHTVSGTPSPETLVFVDSVEEYRYLRYLGPAGSYCNIAEMAFYMDGAAPPPPFSLEVTSSSTAPATDGDDAFYFPNPAITADGDNIGGGDDEFTYVAHDRPSQGMSFTTGSNPEGYSLEAITFQTVSYGTTYIKLEAGDRFGFAFGELDGTTKIPSYTNSTAEYVGTDYPDIGATTGQGTYFTFNLSGAGIELAPNTTYYFEVTADTAPLFVEWNGSAAGGYPDGEAFGGLTGSDAVIDATYTPLTGDRSFHADLTAVVGDDFTSWVSDPAFGLDPSEQGFDHDPDRDGVANGLENFLGTDPSQFSPALSAQGLTGNTFIFRHPQNGAPASDVAASYRWTTDLESWHADGETVGGTTVNFSVSPDDPEVGMTTVTATIPDALPAGLFVAIEVIQTGAP